MNEEQRELFFDLLTRKAIHGLSEAEERELEKLGGKDGEMEFRSLEITAAAIGISGLDSIEVLPLHLRERILDASNEFVPDAHEAASPWPPPPKVESGGERTGFGSWFGWLGWAAAVAACIALAVNLWYTRSDFSSRDVTTAVQQPLPLPLTPAELRDEMLRSTADLIRTNWTSPDPKAANQVSGDIIWSDEKQAGYMRFRGLPVRTGPDYCYQLWIFDKTQDKATPIDGGIFDVTADGEIIVAINAKLRAVQPEMFAITVERHGGVVVSKRENIAAIAKVET